MAGVLGSQGREFVESCVFPMAWRPQRTGWNLPTETVLGQQLLQEPLGLCVLLPYLWVGPKLGQWLHQPAKVDSFSVQVASLCFSRLQWF